MSSFFTITDYDGEEVTVASEVEDQDGDEVHVQVCEVEV